MIATQTATQKEWDIITKALNIQWEEDDKWEEFGDQTYIIEETEGDFSYCNNSYIQENNMEVVENLDFILNCKTIKDDAMTKEISQMHIDNAGIAVVGMLQGVIANYNKNGIQATIKVVEAALNDTKKAIESLG